MNTETHTTNNLTSNFWTPAAPNQEPSSHPSTGKQSANPAPDHSPALHSAFDEGGSRTRMTDHGSHLTSRSKPRGKIAELPKPQRDLIHQFLDKGATPIFEGPRPDFDLHHGCHFNLRRRIVSPKQLRCDFPMRHRDARKTRRELGFVKISKSCVGTTDHWELKARRELHTKCVEITHPLRVKSCTLLGASRWYGACWPAPWNRSPFSEVAV